MTERGRPWGRAAGGRAQPLRWRPPAKLATTQSTLIDAHAFFSANNQRSDVYRRMFGTQNLALFLLTGILLNLTPGQDTLYIVGRSIAQGQRAGLLSALGIASGSVVHTLAAAFGLSAILATSAYAFAAVKFIGAAYLVYLGIRMWIDKSAVKGDPHQFRADGWWVIYRDALVTNVLNPKVALFFLAFLPQFVDPAANSKLVAFLFLGSVFITTGTIWCAILALAASAISARLQSGASAGAILRRLTGTLFIALGVKLAVTKG